MRCIRVHGVGPVVDADVVLRSRSGHIESHRTDENGCVHLEPGALQADEVLIKPPCDYLPERVSVAEGDLLDVRCTQIPPSEDALAWWLRAVGIDQYDEARGNGICVGVIDSGLEQHAAVAHVKSVGRIEQSGSFIEDDDGLPTFGADTVGHGTHVCGIIAGRPVSSHLFSGVAPGAEVYSLRVTAGDHAVIDTPALTEAIEVLLAERPVHLINISMSHKDVPKTGGGDSILEDAIDAAWQRGVLCICASGNHPDEDVRPVGLPARLPRAIAVGAIGRDDEAQKNSMHASTIPGDHQQGGAPAFFPAAFSGRGEGLNCCAPGVGIAAPAALRPWPQAEPLGDCPYTTHSGTSMATPLVTGLLACLLADNPDYNSFDPDAERAEFAFNLLRSYCQALEMPTDCQGWGMPVFAPQQPETRNH